MRSLYFLFITAMLLLMILNSCSAFSYKKEITSAHDGERAYPDTTYPAEDRNRVTMRNMNEGLNLTGSEREILLERAKQGDPDASLRLAEYYDFYENNYDEADVWMKRAAEAGHIIAQYNFALMSLSQEIRAVNGNTETCGSQFPIPKTERLSGNIINAVEKLTC